MEFQQTGELEEDVWFDDVDPMLLEPSNNLKQRKLSVALVDEEGTDGLTKHVAVDCEMVGVGYKGQESILARVSIVNEFGKCVYDKYVKPREKVTDYRTDVSGIKAHHIQSEAVLRKLLALAMRDIQGQMPISRTFQYLKKEIYFSMTFKEFKDAYEPCKKQVEGIFLLGPLMDKVTDFRRWEEFQDVQREVADIFKDRIIVGHALSNDLKVLFLGHPRRKVRDTSDYKPFRRLNKGSKPSLKKLAQVILNKTIQAGQHDSIEDACVAMKLYMLNRKEWERSNKSKGVLKQTKYFCTNDSKSIKDEKRRKIKIFKIRNLQKKRR
ncbi:RNA exonuclease 4-like isoform X1 [Antedon mediterranea]|uniref:RNA exonuclease 4-like isoform X1 n=1 Tax=Antedon mediterranea TaxID=105859 RepID=UPI003AF91B06